MTDNLTYLGEAAQLSKFDENPGYFGRILSNIKIKVLLQVIIEEFATEKFFSRLEG